MKSRKNRPKNSNKKLKYCEINMFSNNCNGANLKIESLKCEIRRTKSHIFMLQETHFYNKGRVKIEGFKIFEAIHMKEHGTMMGVHVDLHPVLISEYDTTFEMLVVQVKVKDKEIQVITGYGPQENLSNKERMPFFTQLEEEIISAKLANKAIIIQIDANSKLGNKIVPNDPKEQSQNGKVLAELVERNALIVANSIPGICHGLITRRRTTEDGVEESVIDFVIISADLVSDLKELIIDEKGNHALTKITRKKNIVKKATSDHNVMLSKFNFRVTRKEPEKRIEVFNFKNKKNQLKFKDETSKDNRLSKIFETNEDIHTQTDLFIKKLNGIVFKCFKKIRIGKKKKMNTNHYMMNGQAFDTMMTMQAN